MQLQQQCWLTLQQQQQLAAGLLGLLLQVPVRLESVYGRSSAQPGCNLQHGCDCWQKTMRTGMHHWLGSLSSNTDLQLEG